MSQMKEWREYSMYGKSIKIFLLDGSSSGLRTAEIGLSSVMAFVVPRASLSLFILNRDESTKTGVYVLSGEDPNSSGRIAVYIGEGDEVKSRLLAHDKDEKKDFWEQALIFITKDLSLTKAHARYLEARLIEIARNVKRVTVVNDTQPQGGTLPEADVSDMQQMLDQIRLLSTTLGVPAFEEPRIISNFNQNPSEYNAQTTEEFQFTGDGYEAHCYLESGQFVVLKNSTVRGQEVSSLSDSIRNLRKDLIESKVLIASGSGYYFSQNYPFDSATKSAQLICGSTVNGRIAWKNREGQTYGEWLDSIAELKKEKV
ncbi:GIY-YIG nuclease family protein [Leptospira fluminis]|uniref:GIY-YIG nuclease family protein n=1 Tax=Leptospira fluminis TaxID=2484979 RepID=A0A4R9GR92_9LEPT|nr:GIY-YIG nuclease family protein [Leptospira fluminis]TGK20294.1 GIY-YIG nuclease family protein [Leptospira fluminis]